MVDTLMTMLAQGTVWSLLDADGDARLHVCAHGIG